MKKEFRMLNSESGMKQRNAIGVMGEEYAAHYLQACGYIIKEVNWRYKWHEIDLIAEKENSMVFVEVKSRSSTTDPLENFSSRKKRDFAAGISDYLDFHNLWDHEFTADLITLNLDRQRQVLSLAHYPDVI